MNLQETHALLTYVAAVDNRRFGDDTVIAWQGILADLDAVDCTEAVRRHFATCPDYLMPVHVVRGADEVRRERIRAVRLEAEQRQALTAAPAVATEDRSEEVVALIAELRDKLPPVDERKVRRVEVVEWDRKRRRRLVANPHYNPPATSEEPSA